MVIQGLKFYQRPIIPLTVSLVAGIALGSAIPGIDTWALALAAVCGAAVAGCLLRHSSASISPLLLFLALGYLSLQPWVDPRFPANHISRFLDTGPWRIVGVVNALPLEFESRTRLVLRVERLEGERETHEVSGLLRVTVAGDAVDIGQGDRVKIRSRIRALRNFNNPGRFDFKRAMAYREIWGSAFIEAGNLIFLEKEASRGRLWWVDRLRKSIAGLIDQAVSGPEAAVLKSLVVGDQSQIPAETRYALTRTGTSHILAISGLHISLVASVAFAFFRWLLSWYPAAVRFGWVRKGAALLTLIPVILYALIAGFSPSTQRALLMVSVFLLAFLVERETDLMNTLALAALCILIAQPAALFSISFQLSFAAVGSIVYVVERMRTLRSAAPVRGDGWADKIRGFLAVFFGVSLIVTWGTLPIGMYYFNTVSFIGALANCVAIPLMGYCGVTLGLVATLLAPVSAPAAVAGYQISGSVIAKTIALLEFLAGLPFAGARTITPSGLELGLFYLLSWAVFYLSTDRKKVMAPYSGGSSLSTNAGRGWAGRFRWYFARAVREIPPGRRAALAVLVFCSAGACADVGYWLYQRFGRQDLQVTVLDVGQGSAVLLEFPGGTTVLVDGGGFADTAAFDVGANVVGPFLWRRKITTVDTLILTHPNSDHLNGLVFIADHFNVKRLWTNGQPSSLLGYARLMRTARERGIAEPRFEDIPRKNKMTEGELEILYPPVDFLGRRTKDRWREDENNNSIVVRASLGEMSVLISGDIMRPAERELVALAAEKLGSTVLIAPHHGSRSSSSEEFLAMVAPQAVFVSCANRPGSGIPHPLVLERYERHGARVYRTDRDGAIRFVTDGRGISIAPWLNRQ